MPWKKCIPHLLVFGCWLTAFSVPAQPPRLALVPATPTLNPAAEVLTAVLSTNQQVALVDRAAVERLVQEQTLAGRNGNLLLAGQLLGADGLLLLETVPQG